MATYAIGDVQGCYNALLSLLDAISFSEDNDTLWFAGDLVNRGSKSLEVLRFVRQLKNVKVVLGNHDLSLISIFMGANKATAQDTINDIISAKDGSDLIDWLRHQPLFISDPLLGFNMVHAGLPPSWTVKKALIFAQEVQKLLQSDKLLGFLQQMYGNVPKRLEEATNTWERARYITNALTRIRFCKADDTLEFNNKGKPKESPRGYLPWFEHPHRASKNDNILFGHWASLAGQCTAQNTIALDTGCVWGGCLSAFELQTRTLYKINCTPDLI